MVNRNFRRIIHTLHASRSHARGDCFLYGYYNSEQPLIQVKICTAVDKDKEITESKEEIENLQQKVDKY